MAQHVRLLLNTARPLVYMQDVLPDRKYICAISVPVTNLTKREKYFAARAMQLTSILLALFSALALSTASPYAEASLDFPEQGVHARNADWADRRIHAEVSVPRSKGPHSLYARHPKMFHHSTAGASLSPSLGTFRWPMCQRRSCYHSCVCQTERDGSDSFLRSKPGRACGAQCSEMCRC